MQATGEEEYFCSYYLRKLNEASRQVSNPLLERKRFISWLTFSPITNPSDLSWTQRWSALHCFFFFLFFFFFFFFFLRVIHARLPPRSRGEVIKNRARRNSRKWSSNPRFNERKGGQEKSEEGDTRTKQDEIIKRKKKKNKKKRKKNKGISDRSNVEISRMKKRGRSIVVT